MTPLSSRDNAYQARLTASNTVSNGASDGPIAGLVLASGLSQRFQNGNKLLKVLDGRTVVERTVAAYVEGGLDPVLVVVGYQSPLVLRALAAQNVIAVFNPDYRHGQSRALVIGVRSLPAESHALVVGVGDQPFLTPRVIERLITAYRRTGAPIVAPRYLSSRGNPVLFHRPLFAELLEVTGDQGGRPVMEQHREAIEWIEMGDATARSDIDTQQDYESAVRQLARDP